MYVCLYIISPMIKYVRYCIKDRWPILQNKIAHLSFVMYVPLKQSVLRCFDGFSTDIGYQMQR